MANNRPQVQDGTICSQHLVREHTNHKVCKYGVKTDLSDLTILWLSFAVLMPLFLSHNSQRSASAGLSTLQDSSLSSTYCYSSNVRDVYADKMTATTHPEFDQKTESLEVAEKFAGEIRGRTILVTGVNRSGIGFTTSKAFVSSIGT